jgi:hypothetical protein
LALPVLLWTLMNVGFTYDLPPFMPEVQQARNSGGSWIPELLEVVGIGVYIIGSYWSALTLGWLLVSAVRGSDDASRKEFQSLSVTCLLGLGIPVAVILVLGGVSAAGFAGALFLAPMAACGRNILQPRKMPPMYARAIARIKFGKFAEAEWEIIRELENWENDFEGWMMLAELYAKHFNDLAEAEQAVLELCNQPKLSPSQLSIALHRLADWHLKLAQDPDAARRCLQMICDRLPGTHLARMAQASADRLPLSQGELREQLTARPIPLPALGDQLDAPATPPPINREQVKQLANSYVERLKENPNNVPARENLARILAEQLGQAAQGIEQITLLLNMPDRSDGERAQWLGLIAAWQIKYCQDVDTGRRFLQRLTQEFPNSPQAMAARRRLELLDRELKAKPL